MFRDPKICSIVSDELILDFVGLFMTSFALVLG